MAKATNLEIRNPKKIKLFRCSTNKQNYESQNDIMRKYFERENIDDSDFSIGTEFEHRDTAYEQRLIAKVLYEFGEGSTIYVSEFSRLGSRMRDIFEICHIASEKGIRIIQCKDGSPIEGKTIAGKAMLFALSIAAEVELDNIRIRAVGGTKRCVNSLRENGYFIARNGEKKTRWGNPNFGSNEMRSNARKAVNVSVGFNKEVWMRESPLVSLIKSHLEVGTMDKDIVRIAGEMYDKDPVAYGTRNGAKLKAQNLCNMKRYIINM